MDLIGCTLEAQDFVVSGTCVEQMYGMCETLWEKDMVSLESEQISYRCLSKCLPQYYFAEPLSTSITIDNLCWAGCSILALFDLPN